MCNSGVPILYHESKSIPWVLSIPWVYIYTMSPWQYHVYTMSPCPYQEFMSIPWVLVNSMHPYQYHESFLIIWVNVFTMSKEIQITEINKLFFFFKYINRNYRIQKQKLQKYKLQKHRNTNDRNTEIKITEKK